MPSFKYKYATKVGTREGEIEADTIEAAKAILSRQKINFTSIKPKGKDIVLFGGGPTAKDIVIFTRQFATMIAAGLPLVQCLNILAGATENKMFGKAITDIRQRVETGDTFADALRKHPKVFDNLYTNMIEAGETGGILDKILLRLADYMEKAMALKGKIKSAMVYPAAIVTVAVAVVIFLLAVYAFVQFRKTEKGLIMTDRIFIRLPVLGELIQKVAVAKFTRTMGTLISSGVPIIEGLEITARTAGQKVIELAVLGVIDDIKQGKGLSEPLKEQGVFPTMVVQMIEVGEQTGALDAMMNKIADFYDEEVDTAVEGLTSLLEPALMVFLGVVVGFVVIAMYMPIFQLGDVVG
ncbi:MAG: type II secretion system F family protein [Nitrospinae bacterium]|nr:type II secretion system F family protein [Nitrospinota bacterium]